MGRTVRAGSRKAATLVTGLFVLSTLVGAAPAQAGVGPSNNFGSDNTVATGTGINLNDGPIAEWSIWWGYVPGWSTTKRNNFEAITQAGFEYFEPLQVTVTQGPDNSTQDVRVVPTDSQPNNIAITTCVLGDAVIYGSHHHQVCDYKQITTYSGMWSYSLGVMVYNIMGHEFGHNLGLRHSNAPCSNKAAACRGVSATGVPQTNTHNAPGTDSFMWQGLGTPAAQTLNLQDAGNVNDHY